MPLSQELRVVEPRVFPYPPAYALLCVVSSALLSVLLLGGQGSLNRCTNLFRSGGSPVE